MLTVRLFHSMDLLQFVYPYRAIGSAFTRLLRLHRVTPNFKVSRPNLSTTVISFVSHVSLVALSSRHCRSESPTVLSMVFALTSIRRPINLVGRHRVRGGRYSPEGFSYRALADHGIAHQFASHYDSQELNRQLCTPAKETTCPHRPSHLL